MPILEGLRVWLLCHSNSSVTQTLIQREGFAVSKVLGRSMQLKRKKKNTKKESKRVVVRELD